MRRGIILITKHFPFNNGETPAESYLVNEIVTLAANAEKVFVIACEAKQGSAVTCKLPGNVDCAALQSSDSKSVKAKCLLSAAAMTLCGKPAEVKLEIERKSLNLKKKMFLYYFVKRAKQKLARVDDLVSSGRLDFSQYDTVYSFWLFDSAYTALMMKEKYSLNDYITVSRTHRYDLYEYSNKFDYIPLRPYLLENIDKIFPCSEDGRRYLESKYPKYADKLFTSFLGSVDYGIQTYKREKNKLRIASCSRLVGVKRVSRIVECLSELEKTNLNIEWTHFGGGDLFDELKSCAESKLSKTVVCLKGNTENKAVMEQYSKMSIDVFVNVSENEGLPISIMEATSFGMPVIATDVGGTSEIVRNGENGFLIKKDFTNDELCEMLSEISKLGDGDYMKLRENSRKIYEENFECVHNVEAFLDEIGR